MCLPGTQSVYVKTWGCSHNNSDSEYMAGQLAAYGYTVTGMCSSVCLGIAEFYVFVCSYTVTSLCL